MWTISLNQLSSITKVKGNMYAWYGFKVLKFVRYKGEDLSCGKSVFNSADFSFYVVHL